MNLGYVMKAKNSNNGIFINPSVGEDVLCPNCTSCLNCEYSPASIEFFRSKRYDISHTSDLRYLFSARFVQFCYEVLGSTETFHKINSDTGALYYMNPSNIISFDVERRRTQFGNKCSECGGYDSIVGARPAFLKIDKPIEDGFYRTDIMFGSGVNRSPLFLVGKHWRDLMLAQKFRGIKFEEIAI